MILSVDGLRTLHETLLREPAEQARFRAGYGGRRDPMDVLRWRLEPEAADHPSAEIERLQPVVHARPGDAQARTAQREAVRRLRELMDPADDEALDEAVRQYLHPDVPPSPGRYAWFAHPALWFVVGLVVAAAAVATWMLVPRELGGVNDGGYEPFASSLAVFDRDQSAAEAAVASELEIFTQSGIDIGSIRIVGEHDEQRILVGLMSDQVGGWSQPGDICLLIPFNDGANNSWGGGCVPPELFDRAGVSGVIPVVGEIDQAPTYVSWGPVGEAVHVIDR